MEKLVVLVCLLTLIQCSIIPQLDGIAKEKRSIVTKKFAAYNDIIGVASSNVVAYSNGNDSFISQEDSYLHGIFMGIKWQCVEYARRWTFLRKSSIFASIDGANDMWSQLKFVQRVTDKRKFPLKKHPNGSPKLPSKDSYLIYPVQKDMPFGHVSVIVEVLPKAIRVAEQNFHFHFWNSSYAREIPIVKRNDLFYINDTYEVFGWLEIDDRNQLQPLTSVVAEKLQRSQSTSDASRFQISYIYSIMILFICLKQLF